LKKALYLLVALGGGVWPCLKLGYMWGLGIIIGSIGTVYGSINFFMLLILSLSGLAGLFFFARILAFYFEGYPWHRMDYILALWGICGALFLLSAKNHGFSSTPWYDSPSFLLKSTLVAAIFVFIFRHKPDRATQTPPTTDAS
jgi:hypothetical protein